MFLDKIADVKPDASAEFDPELVERVEQAYGEFLEDQEKAQTILNMTAPDGVEPSYANPFYEVHREITRTLDERLLENFGRSVEGIMRSTYGIVGAGSLQFTNPQEFFTQFKTRFGTDLTSAYRQEVSDAARYQLGMKNGWRNPAQIDAAKNAVSFPYFYHEDSFWDDGANTDSIRPLDKFLKVTLSEDLEIMKDTETSFRHDFTGVNYAQGKKGSIFKSLRFYKNGALKMVFHSREGMVKFLTTLDPDNTLDY